MTNQDKTRQGGGGGPAKREAQDREKGHHAQSTVDRMDIEAPTERGEGERAEEGKGPSRPHGDKAAGIIPDEQQSGK